MLCRHRMAMAIDLVAIPFGWRIINGGVRKWIPKILFTGSIHEYQIGTTSKTFQRKSDR